MSWLTLAITAYAFLALVNIIDKALISNFIKDARVYTFLVGTFGLLSIVFIPFGFRMPDATMLSLALITGVWVFLSLHWLFRALSIGEASSVIPVIGGAAPVFTAVLAAMLLGDRFSAPHLLAIGLLVAGTLIIIRVPREHHWWSDLITRFRHPRRSHYAVLAWGSAFAFALSFVLSKYIFMREGFVSGFIIIRFGTFLASLSVLFIPRVRAHLRETFTHFMSRRGALFFGNQGLGAAAIVLQSYAISIGNVSYVQALQGIQYAFVFALALAASVFLPKILKEYLTPRVIIEKSIASFLIIAGTALLALL